MPEKYIIFEFISVVILNLSSHGNESVIMFKDAYYDFPDKENKKTHNWSVNEVFSFNISSSLIMYLWMFLIERRVRDEIRFLVSLYEQGRF